MASEPEDANFVSKLDEADQKKAKDELNELNALDREIAVQTFRKWVLEQEWLKSPTNFAFLLRFLRVRKFSQLGARETLENFWTGRTGTPEWFRNVDPADETLQEILKSGCFLCPMKPDKHGRRIFISRASAVVNMDLVKRWGINYFKARFLVHDWMTRDEAVQVNGVVTYLDFTGLTLPVLMATAGPDKSRKITQLTQNSLPMRLKAVHMYNEPTFLDVLLSVVNTLLRQKIKDRIILHGKSLVGIYEDVGMAALPVEYLPDEYTGPSAGSIKDITNEMIEDMMRPEFREYIKDLSGGNYGVDTDKRKSDEEPAASFRKLNVA